MKIAQTFWSAKKDTLKDSYGWYSPVHHIQSWVLSSNLLRKYYSEVELYTDKSGYELLIAKLKLPYTKVHVVLDDLNNYDPNLWALPKIYTYSLQEKPFIHIDGDVFIWEKFSNELTNSDLITQNKESATQYYQNIWDKLENNLSYFPEEIIRDREANKEIKAYNAGIFGGNNLNFIKEYSKRAFDFVDRNISRLEKISITDFNIFFEQYLFYCLSKELRVGCLFDEVIEDNGYKGFGNFEDVPKTKSYLHLLGTYKRDLKTCEKMSKQLLLEFPDEYLKTLNLFDNNSHKIYKKIINNKGTFNSLSFKCYYDNSLRVSKYPRTFEILSKYKNIPSIEIESLFKSNKIYKTIEDSNDDMSLSIYKYEKEIECYLSSLFSVDTYDLCKKNFENIKLYTKFVRTPLQFSLSTRRNVLKLKSSYLIGDDTTFFIGEDPNKVFTRIIIPKLEKPFYQEVIIDELDEFILKELEKTLTISQLQKEVEKYFDAEDLENSRTEYEKLIFSKTKMLIYNNVINPVQNTVRAEKDEKKSLVNINV